MLCLNECTRFNALLQLIKADLTSLKAVVVGTQGNARAAMCITCSVSERTSVQCSYFFFFFFTAVSVVRRSQTFVLYFTA